MPRRVWFGAGDRQEDNVDEAQPGTSHEESERPERNLAEDDPAIDHTMHISQLASCGSVCAIRPAVASTIYDYFLFEVTEPVHTLTSDQTDAYGNAFHRGCDVLTGFFYDVHKEKRAGTIYKFNRKKCAIIPKESVLYVGIELRPERGKDLGMLRATDHSDILACLF